VLRDAIKRLDVKAVRDDANCSRHHVAPQRKEWVRTSETVPDAIQ